MDGGALILKTLWRGRESERTKRMRYCSQEYKKREFN